MSNTCSDLKAKNVIAPYTSSITRRYFNVFQITGPVERPSGHIRHNSYKIGSVYKYHYHYHFMLYYVPEYIVVAVRTVRFGDSWCSLNCKTSLIGETEGRASCCC